MTIHHIKKTVSFEGLQDSGTVGSPLSAPACALKSYEVPLEGVEDPSTGVWECSPGSFRREVTRAEVMHFLSGECTFTPDGGDPMHIEAGDTLFMPPNTTGVWVIKATVRKVFTLL
jgi:Predicted enzyme of the cupin superfamily